jgi:hypothetical protein
MIEKLRQGGIQGFHICTLNLERSVRRVLEGLGWVQDHPSQSFQINGEGGESDNKVITTVSLVSLLFRHLNPIIMCFRLKSMTYLHLESQMPIPKDRMESSTPKLSQSHSLQSSRIRNRGILGRTIRPTGTSFQMDVS